MGKLKTPYAQAWNEFEQTDAFKDAANLLTLGNTVADEKYQRNRLRTAFDAGWNSKTSLILDSFSRTLKDLRDIEERPPS